jgi:hypothetical protein
MFPFYFIALKNDLIDGFFIYSAISRSCCGMISE